MTRLEKLEKIAEAARAVVEWVEQGAWEGADDSTQALDSLRAALALPGETAEAARPLMVIERKTLAEWMKDPSFRAQLNAMAGATLTPSPSPGENKEGA